jgi:hypothetical protein
MFNGSMPGFQPGRTGSNPVAHSDAGMRSMVACQLAKLEVPVRVRLSAPPRHGSLERDAGCNPVEESSILSRVSTPFGMDAQQSVLSSACQVRFLGGAQTPGSSSSKDAGPSRQRHGCKSRTGCPTPIVKWTITLVYGTRNPGSNPGRGTVSPRPAGCRHGSPKPVVQVQLLAGRLLTAWITSCTVIVARMEQRWLVGLISRKSGCSIHPLATNATTLGGRQLS